MLRYKTLYLLRVFKISRNTWKKYKDNIKQQICNFILILPFHAVWNSQRENGVKKNLDGIKAIRRYLKEFFSQNLHETEFWDGFLRKMGSIGRVSFETGRRKNGGQSHGSGYRSSLLDQRVFLNDLATWRGKEMNMCRFHLW